MYILNKKCTTYYSTEHSNFIHDAPDFCCSLSHLAAFIRDLFFTFWTDSTTELNTISSCTQNIKTFDINSIWIAC